MQQQEFIKSYQKKEKKRGVDTNMTPCLFQEASKE